MTATVRAYVERGHVDGFVVCISRIIESQGKRSFPHVQPLVRAWEENPDMEILTYNDIVNPHDVCRRVNDLNGISACSSF